MDGVLAACVLALLAFPIAAVIAAAGQPVRPTAAGALPALGTHRASPAVRDLPLVGTFAGADPARRVDRAALRTAVSRQSTRLLGARAAAKLRAYLDGGRLIPPAGVSPKAYPYRYRGLTRFLHDALAPRLTAAQARTASVLGGLLVLAAATDGATNATEQGAFAVLDRARGAGTCDAQLNLAFLVATSPARDGDIERELGAADRACPRDPTALWLHGQHRSLTTGGAAAIFEQLQRHLPGSAAGWSGAADDLLRAAYLDDDAGRPFTARNRFARALALYRRARALDDDPALAAGEARALAGLGRYGEAARLQARAAGATGRPAALQARLLEYLERAHRFAAAVAQARRLAARAPFPDGRALFLPTPSEPGAISDQNAGEPISLGAGRLRPVALDPRPILGGPAVGALSVLDSVPFIPTFRSVTGVTGIDRWCPSWALRRDLVLAGRPAEALAGMPATFTRIDPPGSGSPTECDASEGIATLAAVAQALTGDERGAAARLARSEHLSPARARARLQDDLQNLWRFAGRMGRASAQIAAWERSAPRDAAAPDRAGEVAYLRGDQSLAARLFARSAELTRERTPGWPVAEAASLVKQGTALKRAGRLREALAAVQAGDEVASRALAAGGQGRQASAFAYHAREQAGDILLRRHRFADAVERYEAARRHAGEDDPVQQVEVLDNNEAVAEIYGGHPARALALARRAVDADPMNPVFLQTAGFALAHLGRPREAVAFYRRAVRSDPTLFPAWNDLGVMLARSGREDAARDALRHAVGVRRSYSTAWLNLGVLLERAGIQHAAAAQGALAQAFALDGQLASRKRELLTDERLYLTNLDLSKPLPPTWDFASSQKDWPLPAASLALVLLLGVQAGRAAAARGLVGGAPKWLDAARQLLERLPAARGSFAPSAAAVAVTLAVFLWPAAHGTDAGAASLLVLAIGLALLVTIVLRARVLAARRAGVTLRQRGWRPALLVGLAAVLTGVPWAPMPIAETGAPASRVHLAGPIAAAATGLVLLVLGVWLQVPVTRALGIAAVVIAASMLTPVRPLDGAQLDGATGALTTGFALATMAVVLALGLL